MNTKPEGRETPPFGYALNTSTVKGFNLGIMEEIELAAQAGFAGIEPWIAELESYVEGGGSLNDLGKRLADLGMEVVGAIGFPRWAEDDEAVRRDALEQVKREMEMVRRIGGTQIAAPPFGEVEDVSLDAMAERYAALLEVGAEMDCLPILELWGFSPRLSRLGELMYVAYESQHPDAAVLLDAYHLYKGGNAIESLCLLNGHQLALFHFNDYPADPPRDRIEDADRVWPGDGSADLARLLQILNEIGYSGWLSLELFNPNYWEGDPAEAVQTGFDKMAAAVEGS